MVVRSNALYTRYIVSGLTAVGLVWLLATQTNVPISEYTDSALSSIKSKTHNGPISYDPHTPPGHSCSATVARLQQEVIAAYIPILKGIRHVNIWGYLETGNKGDAAIWSAQQVLLSTFGIETMEVCRWVKGCPIRMRADRRFVEHCDLAKFRGALEKHKGYSAIIMAGGGNFNDYYWLDQPARIKMTEMYPDFPIRAFPQSIYMTRENSIKQTIDVFSAHNDVQLGARDQPSFDWLEASFGPNEANGYKDTGVNRTLTPDIVYVLGERPDYISTASPKKYDILINSRNDRETSHLDTSSLNGTEGTIRLGRHLVRWSKVNWDNTPVPDLNDPESKTYNQRAYMKYNAGFQLHGDAELVVTDKLHGHIISTLVGVPHILLDSKLGKNLAYHDTWTLDCENTRIASDFDQVLAYATMFFEREYREGRWRSAVDE